MRIAAREDRFDEVNLGSGYSDEEREFIMAIERYQRESGRRFLSWHEVLRIAKELGYRKVAPERTRCEGAD